MSCRVISQSASSNALRLLLAGVLLTSLAGEATAQPQLVPVQGVLTDDLGNLLSATDVEFTFRVYATPTGPTTAALFSEQVLVDVLDGSFLHYLGVGNVLNLDLFDGSDRYLGISVNGEAELLPRIALGTTPYAAYAANAGGVDWSTVTGIPADLADGDDDTQYDAQAPLVLNVVTNTFGLSNVGCAPGSGWIWNGATWVCEPAEQLSYTAGTGLSLAGSVFATNAPVCGAEEYSVWTSGGWSCAADLGLRSLSAGAGIAVLGNQVAIAADACAPDEYLTWDGAGFACVADVSAALTGGTGITVAGGEIGIDALVCGEDQSSVWTALGWACRNDQTGLTSLAAGNGISVTGNEIAISAAPCDPGEYLSWDGTTFTCVSDASASISAGDGLGFDAGTIFVDAPVCQSGQFLQWDGEAWGCAADQTGITSLVAGAGIGTSGSTVSIASPTCVVGQYLSWDGSAFVCVSDVSEALAAGAGLTLAGTTLSVSAPTCQAGRFLQWNGTAWGCADDEVGLTSLSAGNGISVAGSTISVAAGAACGANQYLTWTGTGFGCKDDIGTALSAGDGISLAGDQVSVTAPTCQSGSFLQWTGTAWGCEADQSGVTTITGANGIAVTGTGTSREVGVNLGSACGASAYLTWNGTAFACKNDVSSALAAGNGISLAGNQVSVTAPTCESGSFLQWTGSNWGCAADQTGITSLTAGNGIAVSGSTVSVAAGAACGANQYLTWTGTGFQCKTDVSASLTFSNGIQIVGSNVRTDAQTCTDPQFSRWTGTSWTCATPAAGLTELTGANGITISGSGATRTIGYTIQSCAAELENRWNGTAWTCVAPVAAGAGTAVSGRTVSLPGLALCGAGSFQRWDGTSWLCEADQRGITAVSGGTAVTVSTTGTTATVSLGVPTCAANEYLRWTGLTWQCTQPLSAGTGGITVSATNQVSLNVATCDAGTASRWTGTTWTCQETGMSNREVATLRANSAVTGGGVVVWDGSANLSWSNRFLLISNGRGAHFSTSGYFNMELPPSGTTISGFGGAGNQVANAAGIPIPQWTALYYELPIGGNEVSVATRYRLVNYTSNFVVPDNWVLLAVRTGDFDRLMLNVDGGHVLAPGQMYVSFLGRTGLACTHNMTVFWTYPAWGWENSIRVSDTMGNLYFLEVGPGNGSFSSQLSLPPGRYSIEALDSWGDGWNGGSFRIDSNENNGMVAQVLLPLLNPLPSASTPQLCRNGIPGYTVLDKCSQATWIDISPDCSYAYANQRMITGNVDRNGTVFSGNGFTVQRNQRGVYTVNFNRPFMGRPAVALTQNFGGFDDFGNGGDTRDNALMNGIQSTRFRAILGDSGGSLSNRNFSFIAVGY